MTIKLIDFEGAWVLERRIRHEAGPDARFSGTARFTPDRGGMIYEEIGELTMEGHPPFTAERRYLWRQGERGTIEIFFEDGRAFHVIDQSAPQDTHWCDPDTYQVKYEFGFWPEWIATWQVSGPKKAYRMVSTYRREVPTV